MATGRQRKRHIQEVERFDLLTNPLTNASVHGAVTSLSPVKKGRSSMYFDGTVYDGHEQIRLVGFLPAQQKKLDGFFADKKALRLHNCEVKQSRQGHQMEIILKSETELSESEKEFDVAVFNNEPVPTSITLGELPSIENFREVIVEVKILSKTEPITVSGGKKKQDVVIGDCTGTTKVALWGEYIDSLDVDESYRLAKFSVKEYASQKYLSMLRRGSEITQIDDIGEVEQPTSSTVTEISNPEIIGVPQLDTYKACLKCKARVEPLTPPLGRCSKLGCAMMQRYDRCPTQVSAKLLVMWTGDQTGSNTQTLYAFGKIVSEIAGVDGEDDDSVSNTELLNSEPIVSMKFNENNVITGFTRSGNN